MKIMKRICVLALCAVTALLFVGCGTGPNTQDLSNMIEASYPKVVSIESFKTVNGRRVPVTAGTGVIVYSTPSNATQQYSLVATNAHVVGYYEDSTTKRFDSFDIIHWSSEMYYGNVNPYSADAMAQYTVANVKSSSSVLYFNMTEDLAILKFTPRASFRGKSVSLRGDDKPLRGGEPVAALGYSFGEFYRASVGIVTQVFPEYRTDAEGGKNFKHAFMHDAITINGNSGGPVFDVEGNLIGLTTMVVIMCTSDCDYEYLVSPHTCDVAALGFSLAISACHIIDVMNRPQHASWFAE